MLLFHDHFRAVRVIPKTLLMAAGCVLLGQFVLANEPVSAQGGNAKPAKPKVSIHSGGAKEDLKVLRETLEKIPGVKFKADEMKLADFGRDGGLFTSFLPLEIADLAKTDIGMIAKAVAGADTSKKDKCPPTLFVIIGYKPDSVKTEKLREVLAKVKGVQAEKSWAGDANLWVSVDGSGQAKLVQITTALHFAGIKIRDPITDIAD